MKIRTTITDNCFGSWSTTHLDSIHLQFGYSLVIEREE